MGNHQCDVMCIYCIITCIVNSTYLSVCTCIGVHMYRCIIVNHTFLYTTPISLPPRLPNGAEYLFIARDEADLVGWVEAINRAIQTLEAANPLSTSGQFREYKPCLF